MHGNAGGVRLGEIEDRGPRGARRGRPCDPDRGRPGPDHRPGRGCVVPPEPGFRPARPRAESGGPAGCLARPGKAGHTLYGPTPMSIPATSPQRLHRALSTPTRGVLGLVDALLAASQEHGIQLDWQAGQCRVRFREGGPAGCIEVPLRKSVVRAVLARVAVLCNQQNPNSVSPYGGQGELLVGTAPPTALHVAFVNTPEEQSLELAP